MPPCVCPERRDYLNKNEMSRKYLPAREMITGTSVKHTLGLNPPRTVSRLIKPFRQARRKYTRFNNAGPLVLVTREGSRPNGSRVNYTKRPVP